MTSDYQPELSCPRCGDDVEGEGGAVGVSGEAEDKQIRGEIECPSCGAPLELVIESALPDALGVDMWIEDRRDREGGA